MVVRVQVDEVLALRTGTGIGVGGGAVVEDAPVHRPRPRPLGREPVLLGAGLLARDLVDLVGVAAGVDPAAARRRAVVGEREVAREGVVLGVPAADLAQHGLGVGIGVRALRRVVPGELQNRAVALLARAREL